MWLIARLATRKLLTSSAYTCLGVSRLFHHCESTILLKILSRQHVGRKMTIASTAKRNARLNSSVNLCRLQSTIVASDR